ncbi:hypothetical protein [Hymenobacter qilianensis]|uniref:STAS/SEC14 domain-containing protein n=1 Tax=Hymenobacter qilianensis TaxID=1385715 RepID=A0A7H0GYC8_9BACT|nr:hypothetical protein [Hymenobacter qilianensis]QNP53294.1 hypothetical protein H9L05_06655 [Hymenobacter qilianensis]
MQYDQVLSVLRLEWINGPDMSGLHTSSQQLLGLIRMLQVRHLLIDMNTVPDLSLADQVWLGDHWMPELVTLTLERLVLVIDSFRVHNQLAIDALHDLVQPGIRFDAQYFTDSEAALHWLTDGSRRLPALAAEWDARHRLAR